jgi:hypothetical protein
MRDVALWLNDAILLGTAFLVWRYVAATNKLVSSSQEQLKTAEKLIHISQRQLEGQSRPALIIQEGASGLRLVNLGNGPALGIEWRFKAPSSGPVFSEPSAPVDALSYLEEHQAKDMAFLPGSLVHKELHCLYRSVSDHHYISVSRFTEKGTFETEFHAE